MSAPVSASHARIEPAPCEECRLRAKCAAEQLACAAYSMYAAALPRRRWLAAPRAPDPCAVSGAGGAGAECVTDVTRQLPAL